MDSSPAGPHHDLPLLSTVLFSYQEGGLLNLTIRERKKTRVAKEEGVLLVPFEPWRSMACTVFKNKSQATLAEPKAHVRPEAGATCLRRDLKHVKKIEWFINSHFVSQVTAATLFHLEPKGIQFSIKHHIFSFSRASRHFDISAILYESIYLWHLLYARHCFRYLLDIQ